MSREYFLLFCRRKIREPKWRGCAEEFFTLGDVDLFFFSSTYYYEDDSDDWPKQTRDEKKRRFIELSWVGDGIKIPPIVIDHAINSPIIQCLFNAPRWLPCKLGIILIPDKDGFDFNDSSLFCLCCNRGNSNYSEISLAVRRAHCPTEYEWLLNSHELFSSNVWLSQTQRGSGKYPPTMDVSSVSAWAAWGDAK